MRPDPNVSLRQRLIVSAAFFGALGAAPLGASAAWAQADGTLPASQETAKAAEDEAALAKPQKRMLYLTNGQVIRSKAKKVDGDWEYQLNRRDWGQIPATMVERVELERTLLREAGRLEKAIDRHDLAARSGHAQWLLDNGLRGEAMELLNVVLHMDSEQAEALEVLANYPVRAVPSFASTPETREDVHDQFFRQAANMALPAQELAALEMAQYKDEALLEELRAELQKTSIGRRAFAAIALKRVFPGEAVRELAVHAVLDTNENVRKQSALALRTPDEPGLVIPIIRAMNNGKTSAVRMNAIEALEHMSYATAVEPLMNHLSALNTAAQGGGGGAPLAHSSIFIGRQFAFIQDFDVEVAQFQAVADPQVNVLIEGSTTTAAVAAAVSKLVAVERGATRTALRHLTGENVGSTSKAWFRWWDENKDKWSASSRSRRPDTGTPLTSGG